MSQIGPALRAVQNYILSKGSMAEFLKSPTKDLRTVNELIDIAEAECGQAARKSQLVRLMDAGLAVFIILLLAKASVMLIAWLAGVTVDFVHLVVIMGLMKMFTMESNVMTLHSAVMTLDLVNIRKSIAEEMERRSFAEMMKSMPPMTLQDVVDIEDKSKEGNVTNE